MDVFPFWSDAFFEKIEITARLEIRRLNRMVVHSPKILNGVKLPKSEKVFLPGFLFVSLQAENATTLSEMGILI